MLVAIERLSDVKLAAISKSYIEEALERIKNRFLLARAHYDLKTLLTKGHPNQAKRLKEDALAYKIIEFTFDSRMVNISLEIVWNI